MHLPTLPEMDKNNRYWQIVLVGVHKTKDMQSKHIPSQDPS